MFYLTTDSKHFIYGYVIKDHSDSERIKMQPLSSTFDSLIPHQLFFIAYFPCVLIPYKVF